MFNDEGFKLGENSPYNRPSSSLSERDKVELLKLLEEHGGIAEAVEVEHKTKRLSPDEVWSVYAAQAYREAHRDSRGFILKDHASKILGMLSQLTDEAVLDGYRALWKHVGEPVNSAPAFFATMFRILVNRRGIVGKV
jgi:hypothetical protein